MAKALTELLGREVTVNIGEMKLSSANSFVSREATFTVLAEYEGWRPDSIEPI